MDLPSSLRRQFPILTETVNEHSLVYLDNAATTQKPLAVLSAMDQYYRHDNANINRSMHPLAERATLAYEQARDVVQTFLNAKKRQEIIFVKSATEGINLVARTLGDSLTQEDTVILTTLEHHANIIPWLQLKERKNINIEWLECDASGNLHLETLKDILGKKQVSLVCVTAVSNVLGVKTPVSEIVRLSHQHGARVLVDAAQMAPHETIDVQALDSDFLVFSGHKLYGPTGIGVLYGRESMLASMPPFLGGGDMVEAVTQQGFSPAELPRTFEAGTPPIAEAVGLAAAIDWFTPLREATETHEQYLLTYAASALSRIPRLHILGPTTGHVSCISFTIEGLHPHDITEVLGRRGVCLRSGHHCAHILHTSLGIQASTRLSVAAYNTQADIDACTNAIREVQKLLA